VNLCITELRRRSRHKWEFLDDVAHEEERPGAEETENDPDDALQQQEERRVVHHILRTLPPDYRAVMVLRHFQQLAYEEIAEVLQISLSMVKTRLFRARKLFKDRYQSVLGDDGALL